MGAAMTCGNSKSAYVTTSMPLRVDTAAGARISAGAACAGKLADAEWALDFCATARRRGSAELVADIMQGRPPSG